MDRLLGHDRYFSRCWKGIDASLLRYSKITSTCAVTGG
jgi:hypothetical protein